MVVIQLELPLAIRLRQLLYTLFPTLRRRTFPSGASSISQAHLPAHRHHLLQAGLHCWAQHKSISLVNFHRSFRSYLKQRWFHSCCSRWRWFHKSVTSNMCSHCWHNCYRLMSIMFYRFRFDLLSHQSFF